MRKTIHGRLEPAWRECAMREQVEERAEVLSDERDGVVRVMTGVAVVGLLLALGAFFVSFAPAV
jgi:hypothetical protein